ncbi:MAG: response regulator [bacterium]|jgi:putative two-component system response regulator|nr:response regulator [bacterium]
MDTKQANVMIVDDTLANLRLLEGMLKGEGYRIRPCPKGAVALNAAMNEPPDLILLDINMPDMSGFEVCDALKRDPRTMDIPIIFISALHDIDDKILAFQKGGVDYISKPFQFEEVKVRVETHLRLRKYQKHLEFLVQQQVKEISDSQMATIFALSKLAESRDDDTGKHLERVQRYCKTLAEALQSNSVYQDQIDEKYINNIIMASPLHDVGKVGIPDSILCKPGRLTPEEFHIMKTHTVIGASTLRSVRDTYPRNSFINMGIEIANSHHEHWNGKGYPEGLAGDAIPLSARIMTIADVYDALRSKRCYKPAFPHDKTVAIITESKGTQFDPVLIDAFLRVEAVFDEIHQHWGE